MIMEDNILVATVKSWNIEKFYKIKEKYKEYNWHLITDKKELTYENINKIKPIYIFFPHWSWIIPANIYENFKCIVFHMTDLPFGRGGSPLQNLISRNIYETKISAIRVVKELDAGDIYCKETLSLKEGNAENLFKKASQIVYNNMMPFIIKNNPIPKKQEGSPVIFKRRTSEQSNMSELDDITKVYDYIRMLDAEGYPNAFIKTKNLIFLFTNAKLKKDVIKAEVTIRKSDYEEEKSVCSKASEK